MFEKVEFPGVVPVLESAGYEATKFFFSEKKFTILTAPVPETLQLTDDFEITQAGTEKKLPISRAGMERFCAVLGYPKKNLDILPWDRIKGDIYTLLKNWPTANKGILLVFFNGVLYDAKKWNVDKPPFFPVTPLELFEQLEQFQELNTEFKAEFDGYELTIKMTTGKGVDLSKYIPSNSLNLSRMGIKILYRPHNHQETILSGFLMSDDENPSYIGKIFEQKLKHRDEEVLYQIQDMVQDFLLGSQRLTDAFIQLGTLEATPWIYERLFLGAKQLVGEKRAYEYMAPLVQVLEHDLGDGKVAHTRMFDHAVLKGKRAYDAVELLMNHFHSIGLPPNFMGDMFGVLFFDERSLHSQQ